jgi:hypothetical protein
MNKDLEERIIKLKPGEQIKATYEKKKKGSSPPYIVVGNGMATKEFPTDAVIDAFEVFSELPKAQQRLFIWLKDILVYQNMDNHYAKRRVENPNLIKLDKNKENEEHQRIRKLMSENRNGSELGAKGVIKKMKIGVYMLNPYIFIPPYDFQAVAELWKGLND